MAIHLLDRLTPSNPLDRRAGVVAALGLLAAPIIGLAVAGNAAVAAALVVGLAGGAFLLGRPHFAAYAVCFGMFFSHVGVPLGVAYLDLGDLSSVVLLPVWLLHRLAGQQRPRINFTGWLVVAYLGWTFTSMMLGGAPAGVHGRYVRQVQMAFTCIALMDLMADEDRLRTAFWLVAIAGGIETLLAVPEFGSAYRVGGAYHQPNQFANSLSLAAVPIVALWSISPRRAVRTALLALLGVVLLAVVLSISRGTYIALAVALLWWVRHNRRQIVLILAVGIVIGVVVPAMRGGESSDIAERLEMKDESVTHRWATVVNGINAIQAHPVFGVGYGQFTELDRSVEVTSQAGRSAHNFYLSITAACGIPALLIYLGIIGGTMRRLWRWQTRFAAAHPGSAHHERAILVKGAQALMIYLAITTLTKGVGLMLWCTIGLCAAASQLPVSAPTPRKPDETPP